MGRLDGLQDTAFQIESADRSHKSDYKDTELHDIAERMLYALKEAMAKADTYPAFKVLYPAQYARLASLIEEAEAAL